MFLLCSLKGSTVDWDLAIKRNSEALVEIVADLFAMVGLVAMTDTISRLPWPTYRAALRVLRPAESALRRLIVVAARSVVVKPVASRLRPKGPVKAVKPRQGGTPRLLSFQLFDPQPRFKQPRSKASRRAVPRIHMFNADGEFITIGAPLRPAKAPAPARAKSPDGMVNATRLIRRLEALEAALSDLPRQAMRLARWRVREAASENPSFKRPIRPGLPPGHRKRDTHLVDELLSECDWLALRAAMADTS
jgi:hypothetical protein